MRYEELDADANIDNMGEYSYHSNTGMFPLILIDGTAFEGGEAVGKAIKLIKGNQRAVKVELYDEACGTQVVKSISGV